MHQELFKRTSSGWRERGRLLLVWPLLACTVLVAQNVSAAPLATDTNDPVIAELAAGGYLAAYVPTARFSVDAALFGYIQLALQGNQRLRSEYSQYLAARAAIDQVQSLPDPKLGYTEYLQPVETRVGPQERAFSLAQQFPWFGTLSQHGKVKREQAEAARARFYHTALRLISDVKKAYYDVGYLEQATSITSQHLRLLGQWEGVARASYSAGSGQYSDVIKAQVEMGVLSNRLAELRDQRRPLVAVMNALLDRQATAGVAVESLGDITGPQLDLAKLMIQMTTHNPELLAWDHRAQSSLNLDGLVKKQGLPSFMVGLNYVQTGAARMDNVVDSSQDALMATVAVSVPIWRGKYKAGSRAALSQYEAALAAKRQQTNELTVALERAHFRYRDALRKVDLYRMALLPKGQQSLGAIRIAYEGGNSSFLNLVDAERLVLEFELSLARAEFDVLIQSAVIEELVASPLDAFQVKE